MRDSNSIRWIYLWLGISYSVTVFSQTQYSNVTDNGSAGATGDSYRALDEIVVTAQKREERLKDVPISMAVIGADELAQRGITSLEDLPYAVPDLAYSSAGNSHYLEIRGISNIIGTSSLIGIYIDDTDVTLGGTSAVQINPVAYDLERVEVLRGPQGTLYGDGSAGGTIRFITKNPNLNGLSFDSQVATEWTQSGGSTERVNAAVNLPVIDGQFAVRIVGTSEHDGGWIDQPAAGLKNINGQDLTNVRVKALWQPNPELSVTGMAVINRNERGVDFSDSGAPGNFTQVFSLTTTPRVRSDYELYSLTASYNVLSVAQLTNTASYMRVNAPMDNLPAAIPIAAPGTPDSIADYYVPLQDITDHLLTDELRLTSVGSGPWQWTLGGFFRRYTDSVDSPNNYFNLPGPPGTPLTDAYPFSTSALYKSFSVFGDTSYRLWDRLTVGAGVRSFRETQDFTDFEALTQQSGKFNSVDPRAYVQLKLTPDVNMYTSAAKGFRSGGFNGFGQPAYDPEDVWTYELGTKATLLDGHLNFNADVFLTNYSNYLNFAPLGLLGTTTVIQDVGRARVKGVEWDASWQPLPQWRLDFRGDYLNARFTEINSASIAYLPGDPIDLVPRYQVTASGQHDFSWAGKRGFTRLDYSRQGPETYRNRGSGSFYYGESDVINLVNFNSSVNWNENLRFGAFARNLLNNQGYANPFGLIDNGVRSRPRTFGLEFGVTFQ